MRMNPGDVVIVSGITDMVVITDIGYNVPHGKNTSIPGNIALGSSELWNHISCGRVFWHNRPTTTHQILFQNRRLLLSSNLISLSNLLFLITTYNQN
jgi:hypothetical protein